MERKTKTPGLGDKAVRLFGAGARVVRVRGAKVANGYPLMHPTVPPDDTYYVVLGDGTIDQMVTISPKGLWGGWDACGTCHNMFYLCECSNGVSLPGSVRHCYVLDGGVLPSVTTRTHRPLTPRESLDALRPKPPRVLPRIGEDDSPRGKVLPRK